MADLADVLGQGAGEAVLGDVVAEVEDREAELADDPADLVAQVAASSWVSGSSHTADLVCEVAQGDDLLSDPVVNLPGQPVALLGGGDEAHIVEEQRSVEAKSEIVCDGLRSPPAVPAFQPPSRTSTADPIRLAPPRSQRVSIRPPGDAVTAGAGRPARRMSTAAQVRDDARARRPPSGRARPRAERGADTCAALNTVQADGDVVAKACSWEDQPVAGRRRGLVGRESRHRPDGQWQAGQRRGQS